MQEMRLISNTGEATHDDVLGELIAGATDVLFASPFLYEDFSAFIGRHDFGRVRTFTLVTTIAPRGDDQLRKPDALLSLFAALRARWPDVRLTVRLDNRLHGKIYLFWNGGTLQAGIVTSANLTASGLQANHEWGVLLTDHGVLEALHQQLEAEIEYPHISEDLLRQMSLVADQYRRDRPNLPKPIDIDALSYALKSAPKAGEQPRLGDGLVGGLRRVFLKPWGTKERPVRKLDQEDFSEWEQRLHFPKGRPSDVRPDDLVVAFATGDRCVLSLFRVLRRPEERPAEEQAADPDAARWPWFVPGENQTRRLGATWWKQDLTIDALADAFRSVAAAAPLTHAGAPTLGAFNYGAGRLRLSEQFAAFVVERLVSLEASLG